VFPRIEQGLDLVAVVRQQLQKSEDGKAVLQVRHSMIEPGRSLKEIIEFVDACYPLR
jgi:hypothetical protein